MPKLVIEMEDGSLIHEEDPNYEDLMEGLLIEMGFTDGDGEDDEEDLSEDEGEEEDEDDSGD